MLPLDAFKFKTFANIASSILDPNKDWLPGVTISNRQGQTDVNPFNNAPKAKANAKTTSSNNPAPTALNEDTSGYTLASTYDPEAAAAEAAEAKRQAEVNTLRGEIGGRAGDYDNLMNELFAQLDTLLSTRTGEINTQYNDQLTKVQNDYDAAIPEIASSYAAIGAGDSTDVTKANRGAEDGLNESTKTIGKNKQDDLNKVAQYGNEQKAKFNVDRENAKRNAERAKTTDDVDALRGLRNDMETGIGNAQVTKATLGTDGEARKNLQSITADSGRFASAQNALDSVLKSSMSGGTKQAAVKAIVDNAGLNDEEKQKINLQYGNVYSEQNLA